MAGAGLSVAVVIAGRFGRLDQEMLCRLLSYDPATGLLSWKERTEDLFLGAVRGKASDCASWNDRYASLPALAGLDPYGYRYGPIFKTRVKAHRAIFCMEYGYWPEIVDHIDGSRTNNLLANLREVTVAENNKNVALRSDNRFGHHGVYWDATRAQWRAHAMRRFLGRFDTFEAALAARVEAEAALGFHPNHGRIAQ